MNVRPDWRRVRRVLSHNLLLKVFSIAFAVGLWAFVNLGARDAEKTLSVPVELRDVPADLVVTSPLPEAVDVRLRGSRTLLGTIDERRLHFPLSLGPVRPGNVEFKVDPDVLGLPRGVRITRVSPGEIRLTVDRMLQRRLPVEVGANMIVPDGFHLAGVEIRPRTVTMSGPRTDLDGLKVAHTTPIELRGIGPGAFEERIAVERSSNLVQVTPEHVTVRGRLEDIEIERVFPRLEVALRNAEGPVRIVPPRVSVTLRGPQRILEGLRPDAVDVYVDVAGLEKGRHQVVVTAQLPDGLRVSSVEPPEVTVEVTAAPASEAP